jgi:hypothetical protein
MQGQFALSLDHLWIENNARVFFSEDNPLKANALNLHSIDGPEAPLIWTAIGFFPDSQRSLFLLLPNKKLPPHRLA